MKLITIWLTTQKEKKVWSTDKRNATQAIQVTELEWGAYVSAYDLIDGAEIIFKERIKR